jgi:hypothetical protein
METTKYKNYRKSVKESKGWNIEFFLKRNIKEKDGHGVI